MQSMAHQGRRAEVTPVVSGTLPHVTPCKPDKPIGLTECGAQDAVVRPQVRLRVPVGSMSMRTPGSNTASLLVWRDRKLRTQVRESQIGIAATRVDASTDPARCRLLAYSRGTIDLPGVHVKLGLRSEALPIQSPGFTTTVIRVLVGDLRPLDGPLRVEDCARLQSQVADVALARARTNARSQGS